MIMSRIDNPFATWDEDDAIDVAKRLAYEYDSQKSEAVFVRVSWQIFSSQPHAHRMVRTRQHECFGPSVMPMVPDYPSTTIHMHH